MLDLLLRYALFCVFELAAGVEELALERVQVFGVLGLPGERLLEAGAAEVAQQAEPVTVLVDPAAQPWPLAEQRLVGDLDGRATRDRVTVKREEPMTPVGVDDRVDRITGVLDRVDLGAQNSPSRVLDALAKADQPGE